MNHGLSAARNVGLDHTHGEYIGFVDSDDWIEPDMYEKLLNIAKQTDADIVTCRFYQEYKDKTEESSGPLSMFTVEGNDILRQFFNSNVWIVITFSLLRDVSEVDSFLRTVLYACAA